MGKGFLLGLSQVIQNFGRYHVLDHVEKIKVNVDKNEVKDLEDIKQNFQEVLVEI